MHWPTWIPYPQSWLRTLGLLLWFGFTARIVGFLAGGVGMVFSAILQNPAPIVVFGLLALLSPFVLLTYAHYFWERRNSNSTRSPWLPTSPSVKEGAYALVVFLGATATGFAFALPFVNWSSRDYNNPALINWFGIVWTISGAYLYHWRHLQRHCWRIL